MSFREETYILKRDMPQTSQTNQSEAVCPLCSLPLYQLHNMETFHCSPWTNWSVWHYFQMKKQTQRHPPAFVCERSSLHTKPRSRSRSRPPRSRSPPRSPPRSPRSPPLSLSESSLPQGNLQSVRTSTRAFLPKAHKASSLQHRNCCANPPWHGLVQNGWLTSK